MNTHKDFSFKGATVGFSWPVLAAGIDMLSPLLNEMASTWAQLCDAVIVAYQVPNERVAYSSKNNMEAVDQGCSARQ